MLGFTVMSCRISYYLLLWFVTIGVGRGMSRVAARKFKICSRLAGRTREAYFRGGSCGTIRKKSVFVEEF